MKKILIAGILGVALSGIARAEEYVVVPSTGPAIKKTPITIISTSVENGAKVRREKSAFYEEERLRLSGFRDQFAAQIVYITEQDAEIQKKIAAMDKAITDAGLTAVPVGGNAVKP